MKVWYLSCRLVSRGGGREKIFSSGGAGVGGARPVGLWFFGGPIARIAGTKKPAHGGLICTSLGLLGVEVNSHFIKRLSDVNQCPFDLLALNMGLDDRVLLG